MRIFENKDCMEGMKEYPDKYFDLAIVDPEYGIGASKPSLKNKIVKQSNGSSLSIKQSNYTHKEWDNKPADSNYFDELFRVSKNQIIFGVNYYDYKFSSGRIVWDKLNGETDQFGCEIAYCSFNKRTDIVYFLWNGMMQGMYCGKDVKKALSQQGNKKLNEKRIHPTQKPKQLYIYLLKQYANQGDKILDTHVGSASSLIALEEENYDYVGFELDKEYYNNAVNRIKK